MLKYNGILIIRVIIMRIEQLQYFVEIVNSGSINAASKKLFISPQGISNALSSFESELGFPLFTRVKNKLILTENGKTVYKNAIPLLNQYDNLKKLTKTIYETGAVQKKYPLWLLL